MVSLRLFIVRFRCLLALHFSLAENTCTILTFFFSWEPGKEKRAYSGIKVKTLGGREFFCYNLIDKIKLVPILKG